MAGAGNLILGTLIGAGGIGAALYMTGAFEEEEFRLPPPPPRLPAVSNITFRPCRQSRPKLGVLGGQGEALTYGHGT